MTEKQGSDQPSLAQQREHPALRARRERIENAVATLRALSPFDLVDVLLREFDWRRLDEHGNPNRPPGLYEAAMTSMIALIERVTDDQAMAERLAAIGRSVPLGQDTGAALIREIASMVEGIRETDRFSVDDKAAMLAATLSKRLGRDVAVAEIQAALDVPTLNGRMTKVVLATKIENRSERHALDRVRAAMPQVSEQVESRTPLTK